MRNLVKYKDKKNLDKSAQWMNKYFMSVVNSAFLNSKKDVILVFLVIVNYNIIIMIFRVKLHCIMYVYVLTYLNKK